MISQRIKILQLEHEESIGSSNLSTTDTPTKATKATDTRGLNPSQDTDVDDASPGSARVKEYLDRES